jgi:hypothetical protein
MIWIPVSFLDRRLISISVKEETLNKPGMKIIIIQLMGSYVIFFCLFQVSLPIQRN